ncbi:glycosyltransferase [Flavobacterium ginsengisoli]|uniref:Glycosyltransferase n=1 Tax=Flavobacterium ginsengisoli TaxID=871694 RepID=A0ABP7FC99_9FLAO|nr:glycosyltransferase family 2 protein [Flavobacterium ginsengisoli]
MLKKVVSIIVPAYNVQDYIYQSLESLLDIKDDNDIEVIIINDGSTDQTLNVIKSFITNYSCFSFHLIDQVNTGLSGARNNGLKLAKGEYVFFMDSDDIIHCDGLLEMLKKAQETKADIIVGNYYEFTDLEKNKVYRNDKTNFEKPLITLDERLEKLFTIDISFAVWNKLYKYDFLVQKNLIFKEGMWFEDLDFVFRAFYEAHKIEKVENFVYGYRQRPNSIMTLVVPKILDKMKIMESLSVFLVDKGTFEYYKAQYDILYLKMAFSILSPVIKRDTDSFEVIVKGVLKNPYFANLIKSNLVNLELMKINERVFYYLLKSNIINYYSLRMLFNISKLWK